MKSFTLILFGIFFTGYLNAQCTFTDPQKQAEYEALAAFYNENPGNTLGNEWADLVNEITCNVCDLPGVYCGTSGYVESLQLGGKQLTTIPSAIGNLINLNGLTLSNNEITIIPPEIGNLINLGGLFLTQNQLAEIPPEIGNLINLNYLALQSNEITAIPSEIESLIALDILDLDNNQIVELPAEIGNLSSLVELDLGNNQIVELPVEIGNLINLDVLELRNNQLTELPTEIGNLVNLTEFFLAYNEIMELPSELGDLSNLVVLIINDNDIECVSATLGDLCGSTDVVNGFEGNPINNTITWDEFCTNPLDICDSNTPCDISTTIDGFDVTIFGLNDPHVSLKLHDVDAGWSIVYECFDDCNDPQVVSLPEGNYYLNLKMWDSNWEETCELTEVFEVGPNLCENVMDGGVIGLAESFEVPYDPAPIVNVDAPTGGNGNIEYLWLASISGCPGIGDEIPSSNNPDYDPGPITQTTYYTRWSRTTGCSVFHESNCIVKEVMPIDPNCNITHAYGPDFITISGLNAPHTDHKVFDSDWNLLFHCFDDCNVTETTSSLPFGTYYISAKMWDDNWDEICEYGEYVVIDGTFSLIGQDEDYLIFTADKDGQSVGLTWLTNTERINDYFVIERSIDNTNFKILERVESAFADRENHRYTKRDLQPEFGNNYYRIKEVFSDGTHRYSPIQKVFFNIDLSKIKVYPNPAIDEVFLKCEEFAGQSAKIEIYNSLGELMATEAIDALPEDAIRFLTTGYMGGIYVMSIQIENKRALNLLFVVGKL